MKSFTILFTACLIALTFNSCKKKGCTDELAINYFSDNKTDDGSCSYSTTKLQGKFQYTWNDTLVDTADVYSFERSYFGLNSTSLFDHDVPEFRFLVNWPEKKFATPDSMFNDPYLFPEYTDSTKKVVGTITDKNNFTVTYTQRIPKYNQPSVWKDTVYTYTFVRI